MSLQEGHVAGDGMIWRCDFYNTLAVTDLGGIVRGTPVIDRGLLVSADNTDDVSFASGHGVLNGATQATWVIDLVTPANIVNASILFGRFGAAGSRAWEFDIESSYLFSFITNVAAGNTSTDRTTAVILANTAYRIAWVFNGAGPTLGLYLNGQPVGVSHSTGTLPAKLEAVNAPLNFLSENFVRAARAGLRIKTLRVFNFAFSAEEALDDYQQDMAQEITPQ